MTNINYFGSLFGIFKDRKVKGKAVPCPVARKVINENKLPQLPKSKDHVRSMMAHTNVRVSASGCGFQLNQSSEVTHR